MHRTWENIPSELDERYMLKYVVLGVGTHHQQRCTIDSKNDFFFLE